MKHRGRFWIFHYSDAVVDMTMHLFLILFCKQDSYELNDINLWTNLKSLELQMMKKKKPKEKKQNTTHSKNKMFRLENLILCSCLLCPWNKLQHICTATIKEIFNFGLNKYIFN